MKLQRQNEEQYASPDDLFALFKQLGIEYTLHHHEAVFTVAESSRIDMDIPGTGCRNLFLRDKKKQMFLVVAANETDVDLKYLQEALGCGRLSFGSAERMWEYLGVKPGSVCPFAVMNDRSHEITVVLDKQMMSCERVNYHPLDNTMTVSLIPQDLLGFFKETGHVPIIISLAPTKL